MKRVEGGWRIAVALALVLASAAAQAARAAAPESSACALQAPPEDAGAVATPGGFLLVYPRNAHLPDDYTGCKTLWVMDVDPQPWRWATLWFVDGRLQRVASWRRDSRGEPDLTCTMPGVAPAPGMAAAPVCEGLEDHPWAALRLPSWPRACIGDAPPPACEGEPE